MDIETWFKVKGTYADGLALYALVPGHSKIVLDNLSGESPANLLKLKYELKMAMASGCKAALQTVTQTLPVPAPQPKPQQPAVREIIKQRADSVFEKETMAMYPPELHEVYRQRIESFYKSCELKFKLNRVPPDEEAVALAIQLEIEELFAINESCHEKLKHWREHKRIMPVAESEDFSQLTPMQLQIKKERLEVSISKRRKTIEAMEADCAAHPEDRTRLNTLNRKKEQLQQLINDLEAIKKIRKG